MIENRFFLLSVRNVSESSLGLHLFAKRPRSSLKEGIAGNLSGVNLSIDLVPKVAHTLAI